MMKVAYLAPELPALSATFVYNEILTLEKLGTNVVPFSVHAPKTIFKDEVLKRLRQRTTTLYGVGLGAMLKCHFRLLMRHPRYYLKALYQLLSDIYQLGINRNSIGLVYRFILCI